MKVILMVDRVMQRLGIMAFWFWCRVGVDLIANVVVMALLIVSLWLADLSFGFLRTLLLTCALAAFGVAPLFDSKRSPTRFWPPTWRFVGVLGLILLLLVMGWALELGWHVVGLNAGGLVFTVPFCLFLGILSVRNRLVLFVLVGPMLVGLVVTVILTFPAGVFWEFVWVLVLLVLVSGSVFGVVVVGVLYLARRSRGTCVWGPFMECVLMCAVFGPTVGLWFFARFQLGLSSEWFNLVIWVIGLFFGSVVSVPFRKFVLDVGGLR